MSFWSRIERRLQDFAGEILPDEWNDRLAAARFDLENQRASEAAEAFRELVAERPEHAGAHCLLGASLMECGQYEEARQAFHKAAELDPGLADAFLGRGEAQLRLGESEEALDDFRRAQTLAFGDREILAAAYRGMGLSYRRTGDLDRAVRELRKALAEAPEDVSVMAGLGDILAGQDGGSMGEARRHLARAAKSSVPPATALLALGRVGLQAEDTENAREWFTKAHERSSSREFALPPEAITDTVEALEGLAETALAEASADEVLSVVDRALAMDNRRTRLWALKGDALTSQGNFREALVAYQEALDTGSGERVRSAALAAAVKADNVAVAMPLASHVLERDPGDPVALVARGSALRKGGDVEAAARDFRSALERDESGIAAVALAELAIDRGDGPEASRWARVALSRNPNHQASRELLQRSRTLQFRSAMTVPSGTEEDQEALYRRAEELARILASRLDCMDLAADATRVASELDQPLLITVMGEFSSGKSTFINAFLGQEVAPTGVTPTTATINQVKYGREKGGRIVHHDGRTLAVAWDDLFDHLRGLDAEAAKQVRTVEILVPLESLTQVNLVDTPGLNSMIPEHEAVARGFIARADAVVWLFSVGQPGKASERKALTELQTQGIRVLGVLNKIDQIDDKDRATALGHVEQELGGLIEALVPVSARRAMEEGQDDLDWQNLETALEQRFFARARVIKNQVMAGRLDRIVSQAKERIAADRERAGRDRDILSTTSEAARAAGVHFIDHTVALERRRLLEAAADLFRKAAREVLELVIPRRLPFGTHRASKADRDYLLALLDGGLYDLLEESRVRVTEDLRRHGRTLLSSLRGQLDTTRTGDLDELERRLSDSLAMVEARVFRRTQSFVAGYLSGGYVDGFFRHDLPRLELEEDAVYHALYRDAPDLDSVMAVSLAEAGLKTLTGLADSLGKLAGQAEVEAFDLQIGLGAALAALSGPAREKQ